MDKERKKHLEQFRNLKIGKNHLFDLVNKEGEPLIIYNKDLIYVLEQYVANKINQSRLLDWVNTIWFSDLYRYSDKDCDCLSNIMHELEELDEQTEPLSIKEAQHYIDTLKKNKYVSWK